MRYKSLSSFILLRVDIQCVEPCLLKVLSFLLFVKKQVAVGSQASLLVFKYILLISVSILCYCWAVCIAMAI